MCWEMTHTMLPQLIDGLNVFLDKTTLVTVTDDGIIVGCNDDLSKEEKELLFGNGWLRSDANGGTWIFGNSISLGRRLGWSDRQFKVERLCSLLGEVLSDA